jgi:arsenite transporter
LLATSERCLTVWVALSIIAGILLGRTVPGPFQAPVRMTLAEVKMPEFLVACALELALLAGTVAASPATRRHRSPL